VDQCEGCHWCLHVGGHVGMATVAAFVFWVDRNAHPVFPSHGSLLCGMICKDSCCVLEIVDRTREMWCGFKVTRFTIVKTFGS